MGPITFTDVGITDDKPGGSNGCDNRPKDPLPTAPKFMFDSPSVVEELCQSLKERLDEERRVSADSLNDAESAGTDRCNDEACESNALEAGTTHVDHDPDELAGDLAAPNATADGTVAQGVQTHPEFSTMGMVVTPQQLNAAKQNKRRAAEAKISRASASDASTRTGSWNMGTGEGTKRIVGAVQEWWNKRRRHADSICDDGHEASDAAGDPTPVRGRGEETDDAPVATIAITTEDAAASSAAKPTRTRNLANEQLQNAKRA